MSYAQSAQTSLTPSNSLAWMSTLEYWLRICHVCLLPLRVVAATLIEQAAIEQGVPEVDVDPLALASQDDLALAKAAKALCFTPVLLNER